MDVPLELGQPLQARSGCLELLFDAGPDENPEEPHAAVREWLELEEETNSRVRPRFGLDQAQDNLPAVVRGKPLVDREPPASAPHGSQQPATADPNLEPADYESLLGPRLLLATDFGVRSRLVECGPPSAPHSHKPTPAGLDGRLFDCEPLSGPCVLHSGHVAERWMLEADGKRHG